jgi:hypothetical protein
MALKQDSIVNDYDKAKTQYFSWNGFVSTTKNKKIAEGFAGTYSSKES